MVRNGWRDARMFPGGKSLLGRSYAEAMGEQCRNEVEAEACRPARYLGAPPLATDPDQWFCGVRGLELFLKTFRQIRSV